MWKARPWCFNHQHKVSGIIRGNGFRQSEMLVLLFFFAVLPSQVTPQLILNVIQILPILFPRKVLISGKHCHPSPPVCVLQSHSRLLLQAKKERINFLPEFSFLHCLKSQEVTPTITVEQNRVTAAHVPIPICS